MDQIHVDLISLFFLVVLAVAAHSLVRIARVLEHISRTLTDKQ